MIRDFDIDALPAGYFLVEDGVVSNVDGQPGIGFNLAAGHEADLHHITFSQPALGGGKRDGEDENHAGYGSR